MTNTASSYLEVDPGGPLSRQCPEGDGLQLFGAWDFSEAPTPNTYSLSNAVTYAKLSACGRNGRSEAGTLWAVAVWGYEVLRRHPDPGDGSPVLPLEPGNISGPDLSLGQSRSTHFSRVKGMIEWGAAGAGTFRIFDIAQGMRFAIEASDITLSFLPAQGTKPVSRPNKATPLPRPVTTLDSRVGYQLMPSFAPPGDRLMTFTENVSANAAGTETFLQAPPGAVDLTVYQTREGNLHQLDWVLGDPAVTGTSISQGALVLDGASRSVQRARRPGASRGVLLTSNGGVPAGNLSFVWGLDF